MARIAGIDIPKNKNIATSLTYIYGIGHKTAEKLLNTTGISGNTRTFELTDQQVNVLRKAIEGSCTVEGDLRRQSMSHIKRLMDLGCHRGLRHRKGLPVRGQRTKTNARTRKGPKKTVANKKK